MATKEQKKKFRTAEPDAMKRIILFVDETMFVEGYGFRPVFVTEGEDGFRNNGTWPYHGKVGEVMPWFFGPTIEKAREQVRKHNERMGVSEEEAFKIVAKSMSLGSDR